MSGKWKADWKSLRIPLAILMSVICIMSVILIVCETERQKTENNNIPQNLFKGSLEIKDSDGNILLTEADLFSASPMHDDARTGKKYSVSLKFNINATKIIQMISDSEMIDIYVNGKIISSSLTVYIVPYDHILIAGFETAEEVENMISGIKEGKSEDEVTLDDLVTDGFKPFSDEKLGDLPNYNNLLGTTDAVLKSIGVAEIAEKVYGNYKSGADESNIEAVVATDVKRLYVSCIYMEATKGWLVTSVKDADTENYYYVSDGVDETVDLYDYTTGELIPEEIEVVEKKLQKPDNQVIKEGAEESIIESSEESKEQQEAETKTQEEKEEELQPSAEREASKLKFNGSSIVDVTINDMEEYDYIKDIFIKVDESGKEIDITVQVPSSIDEETAKMAGEDVARYLASCASWANDYYTSPGSSNIGGIYDKYNLLIYIDDGLHSFDIYGAKVTTARKITWR